MSTNYFDTLIEIADDCPARHAAVPPVNGEKKTVAALQHELIAAQPHTYTSDDVLFEVFARRGNVPAEDWESARRAFFAKDQACLRASPLCKRYGWGIHHDADGRVALVAVESGEYASLQSDPAIACVKAMRSRRA